MEKEETIFEQLDRLLCSIRHEIRAAEPDAVSIDFWLYKIEIRIKILKSMIEPIKI